MALRATTESVVQLQPVAHVESTGSIDREGILRKAFRIYLVVLLVPFVALVIAALMTFSGGPPLLDRRTADLAYILNMAWVAIVAPASFFLQEHFFTRYFKGRPVPPEKYIRGKLSVWIGLLSGAIISAALVGLSHTIFPQAAAFIICYVLLLTQYPLGRALYPNNGNKDSDQLYQEPK